MPMSTHGCQVIITETSEVTNLTLESVSSTTYLYWLAILFTGIIKAFLLARFIKKLKETNKTITCVAHFT